jgi:hypothetical protein
MAENMGNVRKVKGDPLSLEEVSYILSELVIGCDDSVLYCSLVVSPCLQLPIYFKSSGFPTSLITNMLYLMCR